MFFLQKVYLDDTLKKNENSGLFRSRHFWSAGEEEQRSHCTHFNVVTRDISHVQDAAARPPRTGSMRLAGQCSHPAEGIEP